jgi:hypothetical protein
VKDHINATTITAIEPFTIKETLNTTLEPSIKEKGKSIFSNVDILIVIFISKPKNRS